MDGQLSASAPSGAGRFVGRGGAGRTSCSQKERAGHRCCWRGGPGGPGMRVALLDWPALEAAVDEGEKKREQMRPTEARG